MGKAGVSTNILPCASDVVHSLSWRPLSLRPLVLSCVIAFTIVTTIALGVLQRKSNRDNGLIFSEKPDDFPAGLTFLYLYFPDILAVSYTTLWNWIDLDVKRLEPWYQLSQPSGAAAEDSLLLKYPLEFMATVPLRSAKRKQWAVFCTSTILVTVFWAVTPLQSGIFAVEQVHQPRSLPLMTSNQFLTLEEQIDKLTLNFVNDGFGVTWYNQTLPPFTTRNYTLAPFRPTDSGSSYDDVNKTLAAATTLFGTDLDCVPPAAAMEQTDFTGRSTFDDGRCCVAKNVVLNTSWPGFLATYNGYHSHELGLDTNIRRTGCNEGTYIANWVGKSGDDKSKPPSTTLFCYTSYYEQQVQATVRLPDYSVESIRPSGPKSPLPRQSFAVSHFEKIIETHKRPTPKQNITSPQQDFLGRTDIANKTKIDQRSLLVDRNISTIDTSELIGFAVGLAGVGPADLLEPTNLHNAFRASHQLLFALAAGMALQEPSLAEHSVTGVETSFIEAVLMVEAFSYSVIGLLCLIAMVTAYVLYIYIHRPLYLRSGPDSISLNMSMAHQQTDLLTMLRPLHSAKIETIKKELEGCFFKLEKQADECQLIVNRRNAVEDKDSPLVNETEGSIQRWPSELTFPIGGPFIILLGGAIACLLVLYRLIEDRNGLSLPSNNTIIQQILLILLPTAFGTLLEPFWVALNRFLCVLQPFYELHTGAARASESLLLRYTSLPPQLTLWRALRAKHFLLATMCATAAIANVLTISLSALFETREVDQAYPIQLEQTVLPQTEHPEGLDLSGRMGEPLQVMLANLTGSAPLPPWITHDTYFLPVDIPPVSNESPGVKRTLKTTGIQSQLDCRKMETSGSDLLYEFSLNTDATQARFTMREEQPDGGTIKCYSQNAQVADNAEIPSEDTQVYLRGSPAGKRGVELFMTPKSSFEFATTEEKRACPRMLVAGWVRSTITLEAELSETIYGPAANVSNASLEQSWMMCRPRYERGIFDVTVDGNGRVLDAVRTGALNQTVDDALGEQVWNATTFLIGPPPDFLTWHDDTLALDWANLFIRESGWPSIIDPTAPLPEFTTLVTAVNKVYQQLYAITLGVNQRKLAESQEPLLISGKKIVKERKVFLTPTMFWITIVILVFDLLVALGFYLRIPRPFLPRMPTTIASLLPYFAGSNIMLDLRKCDGTEEDAVSHFKNSDHSYGFGKYMGTDDQVNIGIDRHPYLIPRQGIPPLKERIFSKKPIVRSRTVDSEFI